jgi:hypothetical protein
LITRPPRRLGELEGGPVGTELSRVAGVPIAPECMPSVVSSFVLGEGRLLHHLLSLVFPSLMENPAVSFTNSSSRACLRAPLSVFLPPRSMCRFMPRSLIPSTNVMLASLRPWFSGSAGKARWPTLLYQSRVWARPSLGSVFLVGCSPSETASVV